MITRKSPYLMFGENFYKLEHNGKRIKRLNIKKISNKKDKFEKLANIKIKINQGFFQVTTKPSNTLLFLEEITVIITNKYNYVVLVEIVSPNKKIPLPEKDDSWKVFFLPKNILKIYEINLGDKLETIKKTLAKY